MHVLNVNHSLDPATGGGTAERTFQMSRFLARSGVECTILTNDAGASSQRDTGTDRVTIVALPLLNERFFVPRITGSQLHELVGNADVVHLMGHWSILNLVVCRIARRLRKPYVVCPAGALPVYGRSQALKRAYNALGGTRLVRDASTCVAITDLEIDQFVPYGVDRHKVRVIPNGIDTGNFAMPDTARFREKFGLGTHPFVLFMGRLNSIKGPDLLLSAFSAIQEAHPDFHLVFAGPDGGLLNGLQQLAKVKQVAGRVHFIGYVEGADKASAYCAAALLVIPSRQEAMSIVALEAGICGTPVLLTDQCGFDVVAEHGCNVVPATAEGIQTGLTEMLNHPGALAVRGGLLREFVHQHYRWESIVQSYIGLYEQLTHHNHQ